MQVQFTIDRVFPRGHKLTHVFVNGEAAGMLTLTSYADTRQVSEIEWSNVAQ
jgi:hypothetical protein